MKKKIIYILCFLTISAFNLLAQAVDDTPVMQHWVGGTLDFKFLVQSNATGPLFGTSSFGGVISPSVNYGATGVFSNPAELAFLKSSNLMLDLRIPVRTSNLGISDNSLISEADLEKNTDSFLEDDKAFIFEDGTFRSDTKLNALDIGQTGGIGSFAAAIPFTEKLVLGFGFSFPVDLSFGTMINGISTALKTTKQIGNNKTPIDFLLNTNVYMDFKLNMSNIAFSAAYELYKSDRAHLTTGLTVNWLNAENNVRFGMATDGMMVISNSSEYYFNDPADESIDFEAGETNAFYFRAGGNYKASAAGIRFGLYYHHKAIPWLKLSLVYNHIPEMKLTDSDAFSETYQPKFLTGRPMGEKEDALDIIIDSLDITRPNLTVSKNNEIGDEVIISIPSSLTFGFDANMGKHTFALNIVSYSNEFSYKFSNYKLGKKPSMGVSAGLDLVFPDKIQGAGWLTLPIRLFYLDFDGLLMQAFSSSTGYKDPHFRIGGGLITGDGIAEGIADEQQQEDLRAGLDIPLLTGLAIERQYTILEKLRVRALVWGFPEVFLRFSFGYSL